MSNANLTIDTTGTCCPTPLVETNKAIKKLKHGEILELVATDPAAPNDIKSWCERTGNTLMTSGFNDVGNAFKFLIRKN